jgi:hypothetical protein
MPISFGDLAEVSASLAVSLVAEAVWLWAAAPEASLDHRHREGRKSLRC